MTDYWKECVSEAFEDAGISATDAQIEVVTSWVEGAHDNYGMAHGHYNIPNPIVAEVADMKRALEQERAKVICNTCNGNGWITTPGPYHSSTSQCHKCFGEGRRAP